MSVPDHISPIVAYRVWQWDKLGLKPLNNEQWFLGSALEANASRCGKEHGAPTDGCTCGVYSENPKRVCASAPAPRPAPQAFDPRVVHGRTAPQRGHWFGRNS